VTDYAARPPIHGICKRDIQSAPLGCGLHADPCPIRKKEEAASTRMPPPRNAVGGLRVKFCDSQDEQNFTRPNHWNPFST